MYKESMINFKKIEDIKDNEYIVKTKILDDDVEEYEDDYYEEDIYTTRDKIYNIICFICAIIFVAMVCLYFYMITL